MSNTNRRDSTYKEQLTARKLSTSPKGWRFHLLIPVSLLAGVAVGIALPLVALLFIDSPTLTNWLQTWLRWGSLPATIVALLTYNIMRRRMLHEFDEEISAGEQVTYSLKSEQGEFMKAKCLCGAVEVTAPDQNEVGLCHCSKCRRWAGGPMFAVHCGPEVTFSGETPVRYKSSDWAERGFCRNCGTHLFYHLIPTNEYILPAGLFQDQSFRLSNEIFIDEKPGFYELKNETVKLTGQQVFAQFANNT